VTVEVDWRGDCIPSSPGVMSGNEILVVFLKIMDKFASKGACHPLRVRN